jgi:hypothetical protein
LLGPIRNYDNGPQAQKSIKLSFYCFSKRVDAITILTNTNIERKLGGKQTYNKDLNKIDLEPPKHANNLNK